MLNITKLFFHPTEFFKEINTDNLVSVSICVVFVILFLVIENILVIYTIATYFPTSSLGESYSSFILQDISLNLSRYLNMVFTFTIRTVVLLAALYMIGYIGASLYHITLSAKSLLIISCYAIVPSIGYFIFNDLDVIAFQLVPSFAEYDLAHLSLFVFFRWLWIFYCFFLLIEGIRVQGKDVNSKSGSVSIEQKTVKTRYNKSMSVLSSSKVK